jgi:hypothetical protein
MGVIFVLIEGKILIKFYKYFCNNVAIIWEISNISNSLNQHMGVKGEWLKNSTSFYHLRKKRASPPLKP